MLTKKRKTKAEKQLETRIKDACQAAYYGRHINVMNMYKITDAAEKAAAEGGDVEAAAVAAAELVNEKK